MACDGDGHHGLDRFFRTTRSINIIRGIQGDYDLSKVKQIERNVGELTSRYSFFENTNIFTIEADIKEVWGNVFQFAKDTDESNNSHDSLVCTIIRIMNCHDLRKPSIFDKTPPRKFLKLWYGDEKKVPGAKARSNTGSKSEEAENTPLKAGEGSKSGSRSASDVIMDLAARLKGGLTVKQPEAQFNDADSDCGVILSSESVWKSLPFFDSFMRVRLFSMMYLPVQERCNFASFIGRMLATGTADRKFGLLALWLLRDALEKTRWVKHEVEDDPEDEVQKRKRGEEEAQDRANFKKATEGEGEVEWKSKPKKKDKQPRKELDSLPLNDFLPPCISMLEHCGSKIALLAKEGVSFDTEPEKSWTALGELAIEDVGEGRPGFSVRRWMYWRSYLKKIVGTNIKEVAGYARRGLNVMNFDARWAGVWVDGDVHYYKNLIDYRLHDDGGDPRINNDDLDWILDPEPLGQPAP